jgi:hypothetical protein
MDLWSHQQPASAHEMLKSQPPSADNAWNALMLVIGWIKHAETKAAATLGASGVIGGVLYTLVRNESTPSLGFGIAASVCAIFMFGAGASAGMALRPRLRSPEESTNLLYYDHIVRMYCTRIDAYTTSLIALLLDHRSLIAAIADQVWANAHVARQKYRWGSLGVISLLLALTALALAAALSALRIS